jgi:hypothetical protein
MSIKHASELDQTGFIGLWVGVKALQLDTMYLHGALSSVTEIMGRVRHEGVKITASFIHVCMKLVP